MVGRRRRNDEADENPQRYIDRSTFLETSPFWQRGTSFPHPQYDDNAFFLFDAGVVVLDEPVTLSTYGRIAGLDYLERYRSESRDEHRFETVGYGTERIQGKKESGGDTRMKSEPKLNSLQGNPKDTYIVLSNNTRTGGDVLRRLGRSHVRQHELEPRRRRDFVGPEPNCTGKGGAYRLDQPDDLAFLASHGITP